MEICSKNLNSEGTTLAGIKSPPQEELPCSRDGTIV